MAFYACRRLASATIPDGVTSIGEDAFYNCSALTSVTIPDSVTYIGPGAFMYCENVTSVTLGANVSIDTLYYSFVLGLRGITEFNVTKYNNVYYAKDGVLYTHDMSTLLRVPCTRKSLVIPDKVTSYYWFAFVDCEALESVTIGEGFNIDEMLDGRMLLNKTNLREFRVAENNSAYTSHEGVLYSKDMTTLVRAPYAKAVITIPDGVTSIGRKAFYQCRTTKAIIPESVTSIAQDAFYRSFEVRIYGAKGSYTETFAKSVDIPFKEFGMGGDLVDLNDCTITVKDKAYTGKQVKPSVTVMYGDKKLKKGKHYTVKYGKNKAIGEGTVTVVGKGDYTGSVERGFNIYPRKVSALKLKAGKGKINASWKKSGGGVSGYELEYATDNSFADAITLIMEKAGTVKRTLSGLESGKTYYVRVRAYKDVDNSTYYSAWSAIKKATVK